LVRERNELACARVCRTEKVISKTKALATRKDPNWKSRRARKFGQDFECAIS